MKYIIPVLLPLGFALLGWLLSNHQERQFETCMELAKVRVELNACR